MMYNFTFRSESLKTYKIRCAERNPTLFVFTQRFRYITRSAIFKSVGFAALNNFRTYSNSDIHSTFFTPLI